MINIPFTKPAARKVDLMTYHTHNPGYFSMNSADFSTFCRYLYSYMQKGPYSFEIAELFQQAATYLDNSTLAKYNQPIGSRKNRNEEVFEKYINYLKQHVPSEHTVTFYAGKLCITPQYLSKICKDISGRPACEWIYEFLTLEAKTLLAHTSLTIQEISSRLNFSDQSTFGKFFKKHTSLTPKEYRREENYFSSPCL